jgi:hypothetical protein
MCVSYTAQYLKSEKKNLTVSYTREVKETNLGETREERNEMFIHMRQFIVNRLYPLFCDPG